MTWTLFFQIAALMILTAVLADALRRPKPTVGPTGAPGVPGPPCQGSCCRGLLQ